MYDLASFKYIFVECFIYVLVLLLLEFVSLTLKMTQFFKFCNHKALCGPTNKTTKRFMDKQICWKRFTDKIVFL